MTNIEKRKHYLPYMIGMVTQEFIILKNTLPSWVQCINEYVGGKRRMGKLGREGVKHYSLIILYLNDS